MSRAMEEATFHGSGGQCNVCRPTVYFTSAITAQQHLTGKPHQKSFRELSLQQTIKHFDLLSLNITPAHKVPSPHTASMPPHDDHIYTLREDGRGNCHRCGVNFTSMPTAVQHLTGHTHLSRVSQQANQRIPNRMTSSLGRSQSEQLVCRICNVYPTSRKDYELHMAGSKHEKAAAAASTSSAGADLSANDVTSVLSLSGDWYCRYCHLTVKSKEELDMHKISDDHKEQMKEQMNNHDGRSTIVSGSVNFENESKITVIESDRMSLPVVRERARKMNSYQ